MAISPGYLCILPSSYKDTGHIRLSFHQLQCDLILTNYVNIDPISKQCCTLRYWGLGLQHLLWRGHNSTHDNLSIPIFFFAKSCSLQDLSSPTRDQAWVPCSGSTELQSLDHKGIRSFHLLITIRSTYELPRCHSRKESAWQYWRHKRHGFNPCIGKIPWRRKWQSTPVFLPGIFHRQGSLEGYSPQDRKESDTTNWLSTAPCMS